MSVQVHPVNYEAYKLLHDGSLTFARMSHNGIRIDEDLLGRNIEWVERRIKRLEEKLRGDQVYAVWRKEFGAGTDLGSPIQLKRVLYDLMGYECKVFTSKKARSVSAEALQDIDHPFVRLFSEAQDLRKTVGTFLKGIKREVVDGFLHPSFNLNTVRSFRSSSSDPNFQNLPRRKELLSKLVRRCFVPRHPDWCFWELDFKGAEASCLASICGDPVYQKYMREDPGRIHKEYSAELFKIPLNQVVKRVRDRVKNQFVFATFYGSFYKQTAKGLWDDVCRDSTLTVGEDGPWLKDLLAEQGIHELGECDFDSQVDPRPGTFAHRVRQVERDLWAKFSVFHRWRVNQYEGYRKRGWIELPTGFSVCAVLNRNDTINYVPQGSSFHCLLWVIIQLQRWLTKNKMRTRLVGQIHDSVEGNSPVDELDVVFDEATRIIKEDLPKHWSWIVVPMVAEIEVAPPGESWYDKKPWHHDGERWGPAAA